MFKNYFKTAFRNLARNKVYSFINIAGLSLGLACAMLIMLYVKDEVSFDRFHKNVNNIYRIVSKSPRGQNMVMHRKFARPAVYTECSRHKIFCTCEEWRGRYKNRKLCARTGFGVC